MATEDDVKSWLTKAAFSYPGWQEDYEHAQHVYMDLVNKNVLSVEYRNAVHRLHEKQRVHEGDRSHPRLVALDQLSLAYPGWEDDVQNAERAHFENYYDADSDDTYFQSKLEGLQNRQQLFYGYSVQARPPTPTSSTCTDPRDLAIMLGACVICGERNKTHLFDPCGHLCACQSCADQVMRPNAATVAACPICRLPAAKVIRVYFV